MQDRRSRGDSSGTGDRGLVYWIYIFAESWRKERKDEKAEQPEKANVWSAMKLDILLAGTINFLRDLLVNSCGSNIDLNEVHRYVALWPL